MDKMNVAMEKCMLPSETRVVFKKGSWSREEDETILRYVAKYETKDWHLVYERTGLLRDGKSCRQRYKDKLDPNIFKIPFSPEEEELILRLQLKLGNKWALIAKQLPGRSDNAVKNFWYARKSRCERKDLPLYPDHILAEHWSLTEAQNPSSSSNINKQPTNIPQQVSSGKRQYGYNDQYDPSIDIEILIARDAKRLRMDPSTMGMLQQQQQQQQQQIELPSCQNYNQVVWNGPQNIPTYYSPPPRELENAVSSQVGTELHVHGDVGVPGVDPLMDDEERARVYSWAEAHGFELDDMLQWSEPVGDDRGDAGAADLQEDEGNWDEFNADLFGEVNEDDDEWAKLEAQLQSDEEEEPRPPDHDHDDFTTTTNSAPKTEVRSDPNPPEAPNVRKAGVGLADEEKESLRKDFLELVRRNNDHSNASCTHLTTLSSFVGSLLPGSWD